MSIAPWLASVVLMWIGVQTPAQVIVNGSVVDADSGAAVAGAKVTLHCHANNEIEADANGRFEFSTEPSAACQLWATAPGYLVTQYDRKDPLQRPDMLRSIAIRNNRSWKGLVLALVKSAVLEGRVLDERGTPVVGAEVQAGVVSTLMGGRRMYSSVAKTTTTVGGDFRIEHLPGDHYFVIAVPQPRQSGEPRDILEPAFFPGILRIQDTTPLDIAAGQERSGVDITVRPVALARVDGAVTGLDDTVAAALTVKNGGLSLVRQDEISGVPTIKLTAASAASWLSPPATTADGHFSFKDVPPGEYRLIFRRELWDGPKLVARRWGVTSIVVSGADVTGVLVAASPGAVIRGTATFREPAGPAMQNMKMFLAPVGDSLLGAGEILSSDTFSLGKFTITDVPPGRYRVFFSMPSASGWSLARISAGAALDASEFLTVSAGELTMDVEFSKRMASIAGSVRLRDEQLAESGEVILLPEDTRQREPWSPFVRRGQIDERGAFSITSLRPGRYLALALDGPLTEDQLGDDNLMRPLLLQATRVTVGVEQALTQDLRVIRRQ